MHVYLDHAATSPIRPSVLVRYTKALEQIGNPSSVHSFGQTSRQMLEEARESIAKDLGCDRNEVIFTSGGTESDNLAVKGLYWHRRGQDLNRNLVITSNAEHAAVLDSVNYLVAEQGAEAYFVPLDDEGLLDLEDLARVLAERSDQVALISLMWANNEIGVVNPIMQITDLASKYSIPVHSDAIAALGHIPVSFAGSGLAAMTITGHKVGSPVGVGALILSRNQKLTPVVHGGGQERNLRSGTPDAAAASAFAIAVHEAVREQPSKQQLHAELSGRLIEAVKQMVPDVKVSSEKVERLSNNVHFRFPGCLGDSLLFLMDQNGVSISTGSACAAGVSSPSHVVLSLGAGVDEAMGTMRITFGHNSTHTDVDAFLEAFPKAYEGAKLAGLTRR
ncbi:MAG: aminotransferase class V-fold PLP-dependent enzyme [Actinobacteria bacterium]|nr:aminotransferase class V-fold PLP-dependent enzyme [Actinomycetota bacterium]